MSKLVIPNKPLPKEVRDITKINADFEAIEKWANGEIDHTNLSGAAGVEENQLSAAVQALLAAKVSGLTFETHSASAEAKSGEFFMAAKGLTCTLPKPKINQVITVYSLAVVGEVVKVKIAAGSAGIFMGQGLPGGVKEISLLSGQYLNLFGQAEEVGWITQGEWSRGEKYVETKPTRAEVHEGIKPSANRSSDVIVFTNGGGETTNLEIENKVVGTIGSPSTVSFYVPAGATWRSSNETASNTYIVSTCTH
jgi:hypothetical protein